MESEILAKVIRGETVESIHRGHLIVVDGAGETLFSLGNPAAVTFFRSSAKPFQAFPFLTSGAADRFGFLENEVALACGSHSGEKYHVETSRKMLDRIGLSEADLRCGAHLPFDEERAEEILRAGEKPTQLHNNCSGKHAAMLALAKHTGADLATYEHLENPVQRQILAVVSKFTGVPLDEIKIGVDGCAAPNFAVSVAAMARSFARLVFPPADFDDETREACRRIVSAMISYPEMIGGRKRLDTLLMREANRGLISKIGADGVYVAGALPSPRWKKGLGIAFKIEDGEDKRARPVVAIELFRQLGIFSNEALADLSPLPVKNRRGDTVGRVEASFKI
ncbi:MAG TPA: asparaginase [Pyrinomonadaceae bacterium]|jgi:L-asparaginase II